ncbi:uncharacterized protein LOC127281501 [Leptopilina boulardi]|uniref:uncharacterized protein LOC127281501 n=1 Tax=Leptopilina boulardi TaxID=63433 RepID=UPI0021F56985|nr:uncharacterized protein LOC127281501 [Leptopilina boulardi]
MSYDYLNQSSLYTKEIVTDNPTAKPNGPRGSIEVLNVTETTATLRWRKPENSPKTVKYVLTPFLSVMTSSNLESQNRILYDSSEYPTFTYTGLYPSSCVYSLTVKAVNSKGSSEEISIYNICDKQEESNNQGRW